jgi:glycosyltransferase involved in cell wall biosynthesis
MRAELEGNGSSLVRVVHVVESLDSGAVEGWLLTMLRTARDAGIPLDWTFYCVLPKDGKHDVLARELGATVLHSPVELHATTAFMRALRHTLRDGRFDVLHCHHDIVSAIYLLAAAGLPIKRRIVHAHNADLGVPTPKARKAAILRVLLRRTCLLAADCIVGISEHTLETILGRAARDSKCELVLYYGIDTASYHRSEPDRTAIRRSLDLPPSAKILLFAGRMVWYKNPLFVLEILEQLRDSEPDAVAVFAGAGPLMEKVRALAVEKGLEHRVRVLGWRSDTVMLMRAADLFVFPRIEKSVPGFGIEGLGLVVVEAQAAGLPALLSRGIPQDAIVIDELCRTLSLDDGPSTWAAATRQVFATNRSHEKVAVAAIDSSRFSAAASLASLQQLYSS